MAMTRRNWLRWLGLTAITAWTGSASAIGERSKFTVAQLRYETGLWQPREAAAGKLMLEVEKRTSIQVNHTVQPVDAEADALFLHPFLIWSGDRSFSPLSDVAIERLGTYVRAGGLIIIDSCEGNARGGFDRSIRRDLARIFPQKKLAPIPWDHVLFKSFYLLRQERAWGRHDIDRTIEGIQQDDRLLVVYSKNDLQGAWARDNFGNHLFEVIPEGERQREYSYRYGINFVMYALCVNYKADQVHIPFILRRRRWQIE